MSGSPAQRITEHFGGDWHATYGKFPTPGHSKDDRGMSIEDKPDGDVLINSFNGGDPMAVKDECRKLGLIPDRPNNAAATQVTGTYVYRSAAGEDIFRTVRKEKPGARKQFVAEHLQNGRWTAGMGSVDRVPYRLPELMAGDPAEPVYFAEGERKADKLASMGFTATCVPFGCKGWREDYAQYFVGRTVRVLPDNDDEGRAFAQQVLRSINSAGGHASILDLPGLPPKGDIMDWPGSADDLRQLTEEDIQPAAHLGTAETVLPPISSELPIEWGEEIEPRLNSLWLVKKTLPQQGLALLYGHPGSGKSFLAIDLALYIALGRVWNGCQTRKGVVVYVAAEGQTGLRNRIVAFRRHHGIVGPIPLGLVPTPIDLHDANPDRAKLVRAVHRAAERYGEQPALIVVDTISKTLGAGKENTDDLAVYVANCGSLAAEFNCCVLAVHHRPKDAESTEPRGHGSLKAGMDTVILVEGGKVKRARITKQKDGEERELVMFTLQPVDLGVDDEGDTVTSCVVIPTLTDLGSGASDRLQQRIAALKPNHRIIFDQLGKALENDGVPPPDAVPDDVLDRKWVSKVVLLRTLSDRAISTLRTVSDTDPDTPRRTFARAKEALQAKGIIGVWEEWVWVAY